MKTFQTVLEQLRTQICGAETETLQQPGGNQAALEGASWCDSDLFGGFLGELMGESASISAAFPSTGPKVAVPGAMKPDETLADQTDLGSSPMFHAGNAEQDLTIGPTAAWYSFGSNDVEKDDLFGDSETKRRGQAGVAADGTVTMGLSQDQQLFGDAAGTKFGATTNSNGVVEAYASANAGPIGGGVGGMVDFDSEGGVEAAGLALKGEYGPLDAEVAANVQFEKLALQDDTVSWTSGVSAKAKAKFAGVGAQRGESASSAQSITFPTAEAAAAYHLTAQEKGPGDNREVSALQLSELDEGTSLSYVDSHSSTAGGSAVVGVEGDRESTRAVTIECGQGARVRVHVVDDWKQGATLGASNGLLGASGSSHSVAHEQWTYELDLTDADQAAAFDAFQATGELDPVFRTDGEVTTGSRSARSAQLPGVSLTHGGEIVEGKIYRDGESLDMQRGSQDFTSKQGSRYDLAGIAASVVEGVGLLTPSPVAQGPMLTAADDLRAWGERKKAEQLREIGSRDGAELHTMVATLPEGISKEDSWGALELLQEQMVDFDDRKQVARFLEDQVDSTRDDSQINERELPSSEKTARKYVLESEIDAEGSLRIMTALREQKPVPFEWGAHVEILWIRDQFLRAGGNPEAMKDAVGQFAMYGGDDALEGFRVLAGEAHVQQFLKVEGDPVWIGRAENDRLDDAVVDMTAAQEAGHPTAQLDVEDCIQQQKARLQGLRDPAKYLEVPSELKTAEEARIIARIRRLGGDA